MSQPEKQTCKCPKCGAEIEFTMWHTINTEMDFAIPDIISGKLFEVTCPKCGLRTHVNYPILFNDMIHKVMIWNVEPGREEEAAKSLEITRKLYDGRVRIVSDLSDLREKTALFSEGLDDRVVEILKLIVAVQLQEQLKGKDVRGMYYVVGDEPKVEIAFDGGSGYIPVTKEMADAIAAQFAEALAAADEECYVNQDWAYNFLAAQGGMAPPEGMPQ